MRSEIQKHDYCQKAIKLKNDLERGFLVLGQHLYEIKENSLWEASWSSWEEFIWELKMSNSSVFKLIQIYKTLVLGYGMTEDQIVTAGGWSVISDILPMINSKKDALKWLNQAQSLTRSDLRKEMQEARSGVPMATCKHKNTYVIEICRDCGERKEVLK